MNFFTKVILAAVVVLVVATAVVLLFRSREPARVEALVREAVVWARNGEAEKIAALIDDRFEGGADVARAEIRRRIFPGAFEGIDIAEIDVGVEGDEAHVNLLLRVRSKDMPYPMPQPFLLTFRKVGEDWKLIAAERPSRR